MPNYRRLYVRGGQYFLTIVTADRRPILANRQAMDALRQSIDACRTTRPFEMTAIVLMPDHLHMIWTLPPGDSDFSARISQIKAHFTRQWLLTGGEESRISEFARKTGRRGVWQRRFWEHHIRDSTDFENHYHYVHYNPVKHGYVKCVSDWPWSSFHRAVAQGYYPNDWGCADYGPPAHYVDLDRE
jgi:putative transposase